MSNYAAYILERTNKQILDEPYGFVTYYYLDNEIKGLMIEDIFVHPDYRRQGKAFEMADSLVAKAKELGYTKVYGSCCPYSKCGTESMKVLLAWGLKLHSINNNLIFLSKDI